MRGHLLWHAGDHFYWNQPVSGVQEKLFHRCWGYGKVTSRLKLERSSPCEPWLPLTQVKCTPSSRSVAVKSDFTVERKSEPLINQTNKIWMLSVHLTRDEQKATYCIKSLEVFLFDILRSPRLTQFLVMLRNWASHRLHREVERPDSFLERFRGPDLKDLSSRGSNARSSIGLPDRPHKRK